MIERVPLYVEADGVTGDDYMKEFKVTYFFCEEHYIRRFIHMESQKEAEKLIQSERDQYITFRDSRGIYHELNTKGVRVTQLAEYHRTDKK